MDSGELMERLEQVSPLTALDSKQQSQVEEILRHPGISHIYGLMLGSRQAYYAALSRTPLSNAEAVGRASVIQGTISGIELFRDTLLTLTVPKVEQNGATK